MRADCLIARRCPAQGLRGRPAGTDDHSRRHWTQHLGKIGLCVPAKVVGQPVHVGRNRRRALDVNLGHRCASQHSQQPFGPGQGQAHRQVSCPLGRRCVMLEQTGGCHHDPQRWQDRQPGRLADEFDADAAPCVNTKSVHGNGLPRNDVVDQE